MADRFGWVHREDGLEIELVNLPVPASPSPKPYDATLIVEWRVPNTAQPQYPALASIGVVPLRVALSIPELMAQRVKLGWPTEVVGTQWPAERVYLWTDGVQGICSIFCAAPSQPVLEVVVAIGAFVADAEVFQLAHRHVRIRAL